VAPQDACTCYSLKKNRSEKMLPVTHVFTMARQGGGFKTLGHRRLASGMWSEMPLQMHTLSAIKKSVACQKWVLTQAFIYARGEMEQWVTICSSQQQLEEVKRMTGFVYYEWLSDIPLERLQEILHPSFKK
jgi:hypothetical protein